MCGEKKQPFVVVSDGPRLVMVFSSGELQGRGFKANYTFETGKYHYHMHIFYTESKFQSHPEMVWIVAWEYSCLAVEGWLGFPDLWSGQKPWWNWYLTPCGEFRWSPEGAVSQIHSPRLFVGAPGIFSDLLRFVQMLKREWGAESNGKLPHLFIPSKTAT